MPGDRESSKGPPDMKTDRYLRTCLSRVVPADHKAQRQIKNEEAAAEGRERKGKEGKGREGKGREGKGREGIG